MGLIKTLGGWFHAEDRKTAEKIEDSNIVEFAKNDLENMNSDLQKVHENIGHVKGRIATLTDDIKDFQDQIDNNTSKAKALITKGTPEAEGLAKQLCSAVDALSQKLDINKQALAQQEKLLAQQQETETTLEGHIQECNNELSIMKTQKDVTEGNQTLVKVDAGAAGSAVEKFHERRKKLQEQLAVSSAMVEETQKHSESLTEKADQMLGTDKGSSLFESLKAAKA